MKDAPPLSLQVVKELLKYLHQRGATKFEVVVDRETVSKSQSFHMLAEKASDYDFCALDFDMGGRRQFVELAFDNDPGEMVTDYSAGNDELDRAMIAWGEGWQQVWQFSIPGTN